MQRSTPKRMIPASLSHAEREVRIAEAMGDLLQTERDECALTWRAQSEGLPVEFRVDVSPLALLGVALVTAPRAAVPGTTGRHAFDVVQPGGGRR